MVCRKITRYFKLILNIVIIGVPCMYVRLFDDAAQGSQ